MIKNCAEHALSFSRTIPYNTTNQMKQVKIPKNKEETKSTICDDQSAKIQDA